MTPKLEYIDNQYRINTGLFRRAVELLGPTESDLRPMNKGNSLRFLAGHITFYRHEVARTLGIDAERYYPELFDLGVKPVEPSRYPSREDIVCSFNEVTDRIMARLATITDEELSGAPSFTVKVDGADETVGGIVSFVALHEAYHIGQLAYVTRLLGGERLIR